MVDESIAKEQVRPLVVVEAGSGPADTQSGYLGMRWRKTKINPGVSRQHARSS